MQAFQYCFALSMRIAHCTCFHLHRCQKSWSCLCERPTHPQEPGDKNWFVLISWSCFWETRNMSCPDPKASTVSFKLRFRLTYQNLQPLSYGWSCSHRSHCRNRRQNHSLLVITRQITRISQNISCVDYRARHQNKELQHHKRCSKYLQFHSLYREHHQCGPSRPTKKIWKTNTTIGLHITKITINT